MAGPGARDWIMVDLGVTFGKADTPGIDLITADTGFIEKQSKNLLALIMTHGHEDHVGAVAHFMAAHLPVYATPFTATLIKDKLAEAGLLGSVPLPVSGWTRTVALLRLILSA